MSKIKLLDKSTVQKIAAGEVIERPASVVKELLENSIDAHANNIIISTENGGKNQIRITDDGDGISHEDLELAFTCHATSKLNTIDDLYSLLTMGFRGEALASIASVARVEVITKTKESKTGIKAIIEEGKIIKKETVGAPKGTTIIVNDLFYNLPVRREFMRSDAYENVAISDTVYRLAIANRNISIKYIKDNRESFQSRSTSDLQTHLYNILGKDFSNNFKYFEKNNYNIHMYGAISNNNLYRSSRNNQYIYVNGRSLYNSAISRYIEKKYRSIIPNGKYPCFVLFINIDPKLIDVNIHPNKQEIKFMSLDNIYSLLSEIMEELLYSKIELPKFGIIKDDKKSEDLIELTELSMLDDNIIIKDFTIDKTNDENKIFNARNEIHEVSSTNSNVTLSNTDMFDYSKEDVVKNGAVKDLEKIYDITDNNKIGSDDSTVANDNLETSYVENPNNELVLLINRSKTIGVVFNTYIIIEDSINDKLYLIDQHAAHERVLYERYLKEFSNETIIIQTLINSDVIELKEWEKEKLLKNQDKLKKLGFIIEDFGGNSIILRGVPMIFGAPNTKFLLSSLVDEIENIQSNYEIQPEKIMKMACINAVKGGDVLSEESINSLLKQLIICEYPYTCPHGRPTLIEVTKNDLEKAFFRIVQ